MQSINFDEGYKTYDINGDESRVIRIRVADPNILTRYNESKEMIDKALKEIPVNSGETDTADPEMVMRIENEIRKAINYIFGSDICTPAFGEASITTITSNGNPIVVNFLDALLPIVVQDSKAAVEALAKQREERLNKYIRPVIAAEDYDNMSREELIQALETRK